MFAMLHQPARRLGAEKDTGAQGEGRDECRTELQTPSDITGVLDNDVGAETQEDTCGGDY